MGDETGANSRKTVNDRLDMLDAKLDGIVERQDAILEVVKGLQAAFPHLTNGLDRVADGVRQIGEQQQYTTDTVAQAKIEFDRMMSGGIIGKMFKGLASPLSMGGRKHEEGTNGG